VDIKKYLLDKVVCLGLVSQNPLANIPDRYSVPTEEQCKSFVVACANLC